MEDGIGYSADSSLLRYAHPVPLAAGALKTPLRKKIAVQSIFIFLYLRLTSKLEPRHKKQKDLLRYLLASFRFVGVPGFERRSRRANNL